MVSMCLSRENDVSPLAHLAALITIARTLLFFMDAREFEQCAMMATDLALLMGRYISID
jgi:hypothetical protein